MLNEEEKKDDAYE